MDPVMRRKQVKALSVADTGRVGHMPHWWAAERVERYERAEAKAGSLGTWRNPGPLNSSSQ